ncbi:MAG: hypothetical protein J7K23_03590 [Thermoproteales archaeon]|nr:hypothetical protein [Thermoproteales archaeon]
MSREKLLVVNLRKLLDVFDVEDSVLYDALLEKANKKLFELLKELEKLKETYRQLPVEVKLEEELEKIKWKKNDDGSLWARPTYSLRRILEDHNGKIVTEKYKIYLTKGGYLKAYPRGEKR